MIVLNIQKKYLLKDVTDVGIIWDDDDKHEHPAKQFSPILIIEAGIVMDVNDEHLAKKKFPISVTEFGMGMDVNDEHP
jgi:hypothetical protein